MNRRQLSLAGMVLALALLPLADLQLAAVEPGAEMSRFFAGLFALSIPDAGIFFSALAQTFAFGILGSLLAAPVGLLLSLCWGSSTIRGLAAALRSIHELFWALLLLQFFGLSALTGLLAILIPYSAIYAKVFAEILEEQPDAALRALPPGTPPAAAWLWVRLPQAWPRLRAYTYTRCECGLRSSAVLGFVGLPTIGYHLEGALSYGAYAEAWAWLVALFVLIGGFRLLTPPRSWPIWLLLLPWVLPGGWHLNGEVFGRFLREELLPDTLRNGDLAGFGAWLNELAQQAILPGLANTLLLSYLALVATGLLSLLLAPLGSRRVSGRFGHWLGQGLLLILRATPEYLLAYLLLHLLGPSMLPAIVALTLHNAALIAFLLSRSADGLSLRPDAPRGYALYLWELVPRLYGAFLAWLFYRWEIILREAAVVGVLGVYTLGFFVDSALAELRLDRLLPLLLAMALLNVLVDSLSRRLRGRLKLRHELAWG